MSGTKPEYSASLDELHTGQDRTANAVAPPRKTRLGKPTRRKGQGAPRRFNDGPLLEIAAEYMAWPKETGVTTLDLALKNAVKCIAGSDKWAKSWFESTIERLRKKYRKEGPELEAASRNRGALSVGSSSGGAIGVGGGTVAVPPPLLSDLSFGVEAFDAITVPPPPGPRLPTELSFGPEPPDVALLRSYPAELLNDLSRTKDWITILERKLSEQMQTGATIIDPELSKHIRKLISIIEGEHERLGISWEELRELLGWSYPRWGGAACAG